MSKFYNFFLFRWREGRVTAEELLIYVPKLLSEAEYRQILEHEQDRIGYMATSEGEVR